MDIFKMIRGKLTTRVDLGKLTPKDFRLPGVFRVMMGKSYHGWKMTPEFRSEGTDTYVPLDDLIPEERLHKCYELIVQTPGNSEVVSSGYLHRTPEGDVSLSARMEVRKLKPVYFRSPPLWFDLLDQTDRPIVEGDVDLIFVRVSDRHSKRDAQRQRVLCD